MTGPSDGGRNPYRFPAGRRRSRAHRRLSKNLKRIPGIDSVHYDRSEVGVEHEIVGEVNTDVFANAVVSCKEASVKVNWWSHVEDDPPWFQFHYWDESGFDCGWHRQPNDHVDGLEHYQERVDPGESYRYESVEFESENPIGLLWEIVDGRLPDRLRSHFG